MLTLLRSLKYRFLDDQDPSHEWLYYAARVTLVSFIALLLAKWLPIGQPAWVLISAVFAIIFFRGKTHTQRLLLFFCGTLFCLFSAFVVTLLGQYTWFFSLFSLIVVFLGYQLTSYGFDVAFVMVMNIVFALIAGSEYGDLSIAWHRFIATAIGFGVAFVGAYVFWPYRPHIILRRLNRVIERKNIVYLQWVFTDFICGNTSGIRLDSLKNELMRDAQQAWQVLLLYPDDTQQKKLNDNIDFLGRLSILSRLLFEPTQQNNLTALYVTLDEIYSVLFDATETKFRRQTVNCKQQQQLTVLLENIQQTHPDNSDIRSVCYVIKKLADSVIKGKNDATQAFT